MKSLSDYTRILRDTANNLNLHGESVEMIVQMLANALYISEVEHIAYSQEASLERAVNENSKIQHCVNQMYSVYRGANPRVLINFKATKLFQFNPYDEIIKSNNFKVYYIGYYSKTEEEILYTPCTVYPDSSITILCLISSEIIKDSWTVDVSNIYYHNIPESNLSGDLYLKYSGNMVDHTRIFSNHLRENKYFDLTLPGYGCRIYYPESIRSSLAGETGEFEVSIFKYMNLSEISESEKKALKITGGVINQFPQNILDSLKAQETYPGLIYISETSRDGVDTLHHRANKNRYAGTYMATNSDISWLLEEYYPSKIRKTGVTYRFEAPKSSVIVNTPGKVLDLSEKLNNASGSVIFLDLPSDLSSLSDSWIDYGLGFLPKGQLKFKFQKKNNLEGKNASYDIISNLSTIPVQVSGDYYFSARNNLTLSILKNQEGQTTLLTTLSEIYREDLRVIYRYSNQDYIALPETGDQITIPISIRELSMNDLSLDIYLIKKDDLESIYTEFIPVDKETIPFIYTPVSISESVDENTGQTSLSTTISESGTFYGFDLKNDTVYLQTDFDGNILSPAKTKATLFYNGVEVKNSGSIYSMYPISDIQVSINPETGDVDILGMSKDLTIGKVVLTADYDGVSCAAILTVKKSIANLSSGDLSVGFDIYSDTVVDPIMSQKLTGSGYKECTLGIPENSHKKLTMELSGDIVFLEATFEYSYDVLSNIYGQDDILIPSLNLYYIPHNDSNLLSRLEIDKFIKENKSYYVTQDITIQKGLMYTAEFNISLDLYKNTTLDDSVLEILNRYSYRFGTDFGNSDTKTDTYNEIESLITKISEVRNVEDIEITYYNPVGKKISYEDIKDSLDISYFNVECNISSTIKSS